MNKTDFCELVAGKLREQDAKKKVPAERHTFLISDEDGNTSKFVVKKTDRVIGYTLDDVKKILDACIEATEDSLKNGEKITFAGFGSLYLRYRPSRRMRHPGTGKEITVPGRYFPAFKYGDHLRTCARLYEQDHGNEEEYEDEYDDMLVEPYAVEGGSDGD